MKISASVYSSKSQDLTSLVKELEEHGIDMLHIDCNDEPKVFDDIGKIREVSNIPIDLHIITPAPEKYFPLLKKQPIEYVTFQYEPIEGELSIPTGIEGHWGLAITSDTNIDVFESFASDFSFILFMATTPGQSGGKFNKENFRKIRKFKSLHPDKNVHVDGGVNAEVSFILRNMGVYSAVVGSYLFSAPIGAALLNLKTHDIDSHFLVKDFMRELNELPIVGPDRMDLRSVLQSIEDNKMAFTIAVNAAGELNGLISNADVRRGLLKHMDDLNKLRVEEIINKTPIVVNENKTVMELLKFIKAQKVPINYLPVVDDNNKVTGAVSFTNLIKGEL